MIDKLRTFTRDACGLAQVLGLALLGRIAFTIDAFLDTHDPWRKARAQRIHDAVMDGLSGARGHTAGYICPHWASLSATEYICQACAGPPWYRCDMCGEVLPLDRQSNPIPHPHGHGPPLPSNVPPAPSGANILDDPRMDGETWICPTDEEVAAWGNRPWEIQSMFAAHAGVSPAFHVLTELPKQRSRHHAIYRPLRLPGMDPRTGIVQARDMTPQHFERCEWACRHHHGSTPSQWLATDDWTTWTLDDVQPGEEWRPAAWPDDE